MLKKIDEIQKIYIFRDRKFEKVSDRFGEDRGSGSNLVHIHSVNSLSVVRYLLQSLLEIQGSFNLEFWKV